MHIITEFFNKVKNTRTKFNVHLRKIDEIMGYCNSSKRSVHSKLLSILIYLPVKTGGLSWFSWELNLWFQEV